MKNNPEILAPAGSIDTLYAASAMGADAVYVGAPRFGARAFAKNPSVDELVKAITDMHIRGKRLYLTVNTLLTDRELDEELLPMLDPLVAAGLDACIVQDPGVLVMLHAAYPGLDLHASTQMAIFSGEEAELLKDYGVTRFVPARELTIDEIRKARSETDLEIEVFVHGALCVCYSGWCLMSEYIGGRSGNRGECAGPCRLPYTKDGRELFELNAKDSETLLYIPEMIDAGIDSFKIEGRMKSMEYASYIAYLYRKYSDIYIKKGPDHYAELIEDKESMLWRDRKRAADLYNRGGFFPSYMFYDQVSRDGSGSSHTIEKNVKGHYGLKVGEVVRVDRGGKQSDATAEISVDDGIELQTYDVLAIRSASDIGTTVYDFTIGKDAANGLVSQRILKVKIGHSEVHPGDGVYRTRNQSLLDEIDNRIEKKLRDDVFMLQGKWTGRLGERAKLTISGCVPTGVIRDSECKYTDISVTVEGSDDTYLISGAKSRPVTGDDVRERLSKMGDTLYRWASLDVDMDVDAFIPLGKIKELRRYAISEWEKAVAGEFLRFRGSDDTDSMDTASGQVDITDGNQLSNEQGAQAEDAYIDGRRWIRVMGRRQLKTVTDHIREKKINDVIIQVKLEGYSTDGYGKIVELCDPKDRGFRLAISLPRAYRGNDKEELENSIVMLIEKTKPDIFIINSLASIVFYNRYLSDQDIYLVADENMYMTNKSAVYFYKKMGIHMGPARRYGRFAVMTSAHRLDTGRIVTPKGDEFVVVRPPGCSYSVVYTSDALCPDNSDTSHFGQSIRELPSDNDCGTMIDLTTEKPDEVEGILEKYLV